jgi:hypothetical protein
MYVEYNPNNSGGSWWLKDEDWHALAAAGWKVVWATHEILYGKGGDYVREADGTPTVVPRDDPRVAGDRLSGFGVEGDRYMGALARYAYRAGLSLRDAVAEWERATGQSSTDAGCPCCGPPHHFTEYDDAGKYVSSGPETSYSASW